MNRLINDTNESIKDKTTKITYNFKLTNLKNEKNDKTY